MQREGGRERDRENSKTLILKASSVRSIWTYLTASPCYTTNTNKHSYTTKTDRERDRQTDRDRQTHRDRDRQTDRETQRQEEDVQCPILSSICRYTQTQSQLNWRPGRPNDCPDFVGNTWNSNRGPEGANTARTGHECNLSQNPFTGRADRLTAHHWLD